MGGFNTVWAKPKPWTLWFLPSPKTSKDNVLATYLKQHHAQVFRGDENDVLARYYHAARQWEATHIVRICADNPFICPQAIDDLVHFYFENPCDYAYNHIPKNNRYPDGLGAEIISFPLLEKMFKEATLPAQREHLLQFVWDHAQSFKIQTFDPADPTLHEPNIKLDVDTYEDYQHLLSKNIQPSMTTTEIISVFKNETL